MPAPYATSLFGLLLLSLVLRKPQMVWVSGVLLTNWSLCAAVALVDNSGTNWLVNAGIDFCSAALMLCVPITFGQLAAASFYVPMMCMHSWLGFQGHSASADAQYLHTLDALAWCQAFAVLLWGIGSALQMAWRALGARGGASAHSAADRRLHQTEERR